jgi:hypothetical protein
MVLLAIADAPIELIVKLSQPQAELWEQCRQLRTQLPVYLEQQRAFIVVQCQLPDVLQAVVAEYAAPTSEDMWTDGLR